MCEQCEREPSDIFEALEQEFGGSSGFPDIKVMINGQEATPEKLKAVVGRGINKEKKVLKTLPLSKEFKRRMKEVETMAKESEKILDKARYTQDRIWADIREEKDLYSCNLRYNRKLEELEVLE